MRLKLAEELQADAEQPGVAIDHDALTKIWQQAYELTRGVRKFQKSKRLTNSRREASS